MVLVPPKNRARDSARVTVFKARSDLLAARRLACAGIVLHVEARISHFCEGVVTQNRGVRCAWCDDTPGSSFEHLRRFERLEPIDNASLLIVERPLNAMIL